MEFLKMFHAIPYAMPLVYQGPDNDVRGATAWAQGLENIVATQVNGNPTPVPKCRNFIMEQWSRAGLTNLFHDLPLVLEPERQRPRYDRPAIAYCLTGISSKFDGAADFERWLIDRFGARYTLIDLGSIRKQSVVDLLPILRSCERLITVDTATLHLGYACRVPTIALQPSAEWYRSEPREHWLCWMTYEESATDEGRARIADAVENEIPVHGDGGRAIWHVYSVYKPDDAATIRRHENAMATWGGRHAQCFGIPVNGKNSRIDKSDARNLPYVADLFDAACSTARPEDIILYTNADIMLCREALGAVRKMMELFPCCYSRRAEFTEDVAPGLRRHQISSVPQWAGVDLMAFTPEWWAGARSDLPSMFVGAEGWDAVMRWQMHKTSPVCEILPAICYHQSHTGTWSLNINSPAQTHNRSVCADWARQNGKGHLIGAGRYLFKADA
jgi:hypothetical protein